VHYLLGVAQEKGGELESAMASYRKAYELDATCLEAILAIGEVLVEMDEPAEALTYVEQHLKVVQNSPGAFELAGRLAMMLEDYDKAERYCQVARDLDSKNPCYLESLARAQFLGGRYASAVATLEELAVADAYKDRAWVYLMRADCLLALGRPGEAQEACRQASELEPGNPAAWSGLAKAHLAMADFHRAMCAAREAMKLDDTDSTAAMVLGYVLVRDGQAEQAVAVLTPACTANPQDATLRCLLGRAYAAAGNAEGAKECYAAALGAEPDNVLARELAAGAGLPMPAVE
jgi:tetratricopeptide (TPR) repeat protein